MKRIAILQSGYIPWKGYFDILGSVDEFVIYDEVQYTRRDWRNRNLIKTKDGPRWLTIPVKVKRRREQRIDEVQVVDSVWAERHWKTIYHCYNRARYFERYKSMFTETYQRASELKYLTEINILFIGFLSSILGISTKITLSCKYESGEGKNEKLVAICKAAGASTYLSGPSAKSYLDNEIFNKKGINIEWADYSGYPEYNQMYPPFTDKVSVIDLIFAEGENAARFLRSTV
jgi:hypothetical protein